MTIRSTLTPVSESDALNICRMIARWRATPMRIRPKSDMRIALRCDLLNKTLFAVRKMSVLGGKNKVRRHTHEVVGPFGIRNLAGYVED